MREGHRWTQGFEGKRGGEFGAIKEANSSIAFTWVTPLRKAPPGVRGHRRVCPAPLGGGGEGRRVKKRAFALETGSGLAAPRLWGAFPCVDAAEAVWSLMRRNGGLFFFKVVTPGGLPLQGLLWSCGRCSWPQAYVGRSRGGVGASSRANPATPGGHWTANRSPRWWFTTWNFLRRIQIGGSWDIRPLGKKRPTGSIWG